MEVTRSLVNNLYERLTFINSHYRENIQDSAAVTRSIEEMKAYLVRTEEKLIELEKVNIEMNSKVVELQGENQLLKQKIVNIDELSEKQVAADSDRKKYEEIIKDKSSKLNDFIESNSQLRNERLSEILNKLTILEETHKVTREYKV